MMKNNDLLDRTFWFGVNSLKFLRKLPDDAEYKLIRFQLGKSATSLGANYEELRLVHPELTSKIK